MNDTPAGKVCIIIPCYCSENYLSRTVEGIFRAFSDNPGYECRLILINDGSPDATFDVIRSLCSRYPQITGIDLDHNYGQQAAKMAGIQFITGDHAVFMDDDGQHDPRAVFSLISKVDEGYDLVYARFAHMQEHGWRKAASRINDIILSLITRKPAGITITSFFALSRDAADYLKKLDFYAGSVGMTLFPYTKKVTSVPVDHLVRRDGDSRYTLRKLFSAWFKTLKGSRRIFPRDEVKIRTILGSPLENK